MRVGFVEACPRGPCSKSCALTSGCRSNRLTVGSRKIYGRSVSCGSAGCSIKAGTPKATESTKSESAPCRIMLPNLTCLYSLYDKWGRPQSCCALLSGRGCRRQSSKIRKRTSVHVSHGGPIMVPCTSPCLISVLRKSMLDLDVKSCNGLVEIMSTETTTTWTGSK